MAKMSLYWKLILYFLPLVLVTIMIIFTYNYFYTARVLKENTLQNVDNTMKQTAEIIDYNLKIIYQDVFSIQNESSFRKIMLLSSTYSDLRDYAEDYIHLNNLFQSCYNQRYPLVDSIILVSNTGLRMSLLPKSVLHSIDFDIEK